MIPAIEIEADKICAVTFCSETSIIQINKTDNILKLRITGVKAIAANLLNVFRYPPIKEVKHTKRRNGNVSLVKSIVRRNFSLFSIKPGATKLITVGINISKIIIKGSKKLNIIDIISDKKRLDSLTPFSILTSETTGTNAEFIAPSANKRRNKFGNLNATKNASETKLAPSEIAINRSRM